MSNRALGVPASFFGMVLGLAGLGGCWRTAARLWSLPTYIGEIIVFIAVGVWAVLTALFIGKWLLRRAEALGEFDHPIQCCFLGLMPVTTMLIGIVLLPYERMIGSAIGVVGAVLQLAFAVYRTGVLWKGGRDQTTTTPILYLPMVAGNLVSANLASALGYSDVAAMFFGGGILAWLALESVLMHRLYTQAELAIALRPTLGIQLAPAFVACSAYLSLTTGTPDLVVKGLLGYGLLQGLILLRLLPWIAAQSFGAGYWAFTFGLTAASYDCMRVVERGAAGIFPGLAVAVFIFMNICMIIIIVGTLVRLLQGRLLPPSPALTPGRSTTV
jgi:tellurite resistance protein